MNMTTARLLIAVIGLGALTFGLRAAGDPPRQSSDQDAREPHSISVHPVQPRQGGATQAIRPHSLFNGAGRVPEKINPAGPLHLQPKNAPNIQFHPQVLKKNSTAAKPGWLMSKAANHYEPSSKLPVGGVMHGRSPATDALGGLTANTAKKSAAALDGSAMKRKP
jgi:hypothetical protein